MNGTFVIDGTVNVYGTLYHDIDKGGIINLDVPSGTTFKAYAGSSIIGVSIAGSESGGTGDIDIPLMQKDFEIGHDITSDKVFGQTENVIVIGTLTIGNGATVVIKGGFHVNEGVTLTIESGSVLEIDSSIANVDISGKIIVDDGASFIVKNSKDVMVSGSIDSSGKVQIMGNVTVRSGGSIIINEGEIQEGSGGGVVYRSTFEVAEGLTVDEGAVLDIRSQMRVSDITNKGIVNLAGAVLAGDSKISLAAEGAAVDVASLSAKNVDYMLIIDDLGLKLASGSVDGTAVKSNTIELAPGKHTVSGLTVSEKVTADREVSKNTMVLGGAVTSLPGTDAGESDTVDMTVKGPRIIVEDTLELGKAVILTVGEDNDGTVLTVVGLIQAGQEISMSLGAVINAARYSTASGSDPLFNYSTLAAAVESGAKTIDILGAVDVTDDIAIPTGVTIRSSGTVNIGSDERTDADRGVTMTFQDGAIANGGKYVVNGTLVFDNKKNDKSEKIADVAVIGDKSSRYTNIYTAIEGAKAGDTVFIYANEVRIDSRMTVPADVTVEVPAGKVLVMGAGVTLTVDGTLKTMSALRTADGVVFATEPSTKAGEQAAAIIINGKLMSQTPIHYDDQMSGGEVTAVGYRISGAYYRMADTAGDYYYVTSVDYASSVAAQAVDCTVETYGTVAVGDISLAGTSTPVVLKGMSGSRLTVASLTLVNAVFDFEGDSFNGVIIAGGAVVTARDVSILNVDAPKDPENLIVRNVMFDRDGSVFTIASGTVSVDGIADGSVGMLTIDQGATMTSAENLDIPAEVGVIVNGTLVVGHGQSMSVDAMQVMGTLSVAKETDTRTKGTLFASYLFVGVEADGIMNDDAVLDVFAGATATVSGEVCLLPPSSGEGSSFAIIASGSDIDADTVRSLGSRSTVYLVEGKEWMTVYANGGFYIGNIMNPPLVNAAFSSWVDEKGAAITSQNRKNVGDPDCSKVSASIRYDIYTVRIIGCEGVENIAIDGNLVHVLGDGGIDLRAGEHTVTYTIGNNYAGEGKLSVVKTSSLALSTAVDGMKFTVSGAEGTVNLQITGISATSQGPVSPVAPSKEKDGASLTDYLLIALVVMIAIMAIIVAMKLMRS